jgi:hypothetical protein
VVWRDLRRTDPGAFNLLADIVESPADVGPPAVC